MKNDENKTNCRCCEFLKKSPYPTSGSHEPVFYWWCVNPDVSLNVNNLRSNDINHFLKMKRSYPNVIKIVGYVESHEEDKIVLPDWCPLKKL